MQTLASREFLGSPFTVLRTRGTLAPGAGR